MNALLWGILLACQVTLTQDQVQSIQEAEKEADRRELKAVMIYESKLQQAEDDLAAKVDGRVSRFTKGQQEFIQGKWRFASLAAKKAAVRLAENNRDRCKRELEKWKAKELDPRLPIYPLKVGNFGFYPYQFTVLQVASKTEVRAESGFNRREPIDVWVENIDASRLADGSAFTLKGPLVVTGTQSYVTVLGAKRTLYKISPAKFPEKE